MIGVGPCTEESVLDQVSWSSRYIKKEWKDIIVLLLS